jgi:hypothetical protein
MVVFLAAVLLSAVLDEPLLSVPVVSALVWFVSALLVWSGLLLGASLGTPNLGRSDALPVWLPLWLPVDAAAGCAEPDAGCVFVEVEPGSVVAGAVAAGVVEGEVAEGVVEDCCAETLAAPASRPAANAAERPNWVQLRIVLFPMGRTKCHALAPSAQLCLPIDAI